ncbi:MAG: ClpXP protease specificity-enhancing factor SspB [Alphaproteobacteria bacterium]|nr:ClpXP protease specificity-enhancing factor SspB [Alphaproteobacteria bacterium]
MTEEDLRYDLMVEGALRRVVSDTLKMVAERGLPGSHHFYISFLTEYVGVQIPQHLHEQYPKEMTIVLQYQYYGLVVTETGFSVTLSFNNIKERLTIPFGAITTFADPSVNFALQFQTMEDGDEEDAFDDDSANEEVKKSSTPKDDGEKGVVISLDQFRKKNATTETKE